KEEEEEEEEEKKKEKSDDKTMMTTELESTKLKSINAMTRNEDVYVSLIWFVLMSCLAFCWLSVFHGWSPLGGMLLHARYGRSCDLLFLSPSSSPLPSLHPLLLPIPSSSLPLSLSLSPYLCSCPGSSNNCAPLLVARVDYHSPHCDSGKEQGDADWARPMGHSGYCCNDCSAEVLWCENVNPFHSKTTLVCRDRDLVVQTPALLAPLQMYAHGGMFEHNYHYHISHPIPFEIILNPMFLLYVMHF
ncbi:hypothetical protein RFI_13138, partial [Reticulomyxa filosa]